MKPLYLLLLFEFGSEFCFSQNPGGPIQFRPYEIMWNDVSKGPLPSGSRTSVLEGNPRQTGMFTQRIILPKGSILKPHWHPSEERVTVLEGCVYVAFGDSLDWTRGKAFGEGSFYVNPPNVNHYVWTFDGAMVQITGSGPWELHYVDKPKYE